MEPPPKAVSTTIVAGDNPAIIRFLWMKFSRSGFWEELNSENKTPFSSRILSANFLFLEGCLPQEQQSGPAGERPQRRRRGHPMGR